MRHDGARWGDQWQLDRRIVVVVEGVGNRCQPVDLRLRDGLDDGLDRGFFDLFFFDVVGCSVDLFDFFCFDLDDDFFHWDFVVIDNFVDDVVLEDGLGSGNRRRRLKRADRLGWWRRDPTRRRQRDECCRARRGRRLPVGYDMFPGQLTYCWAVEIGEWFIVDDTEVGGNGRL